MDNSSRQRWLSTVILVGVLYLALGITSATLAAAAASNQMRACWRLAVFIFSAVVFLAHIAYEHFRLRNRPQPIAWHASVAIAFGAFALALLANIHDLGSAGYRPRMLIAMVAWPLLTALPAFIVALTAAACLARARRRG
jgi:hypothetical protein